MYLVAIFTSASEYIYVPVPILFQFYGYLLLILLSKIAVQLK